MKNKSLSKAWGVILLSLCLGLVAAGCAKKEEVKETVETSDQVSESSEESKEESKENIEEDVIENVDYIYATSENENIVIENEGYEELKASVEEFNKSISEYKRSNGIGEDSEYRIYTRVVRADSKAFSVVSEESIYKDLDPGQGVKNSKFNIVNYNSKDGKELKLSDIASDGIYKVLADELKTAYPTVKFADDAEAKLKEELSKQGWESKADWTLSYDGIIFYIQKELISFSSSSTTTFDAVEPMSTPT